ncbi:MAG: tyrosine transporter [Chlamydiae bacterium]|nr:tyrosine transporter [Chlamydiota bacterium]
MKTSFLKICSGSLLVAGTAIGAGMLALPVATAEGGFFPALAMYGICWFFMAVTGLLMLEVCLWMPKDANLVSMSYHLLGTKGKMLSWILYLFLFYCLSIAYVAGGGGFVSSVTQGMISPKLGIAIFTLIFAPIVYIGTKAVDRANMILMVGLILSYFAFVFLGYKHVNLTLLSRQNWPVAFFALPIIFTSFSYQGIIPSLTSYFHSHAKSVRWSILIGTAIPLIIYIIWEMLILGIVPLEGSSGLLAARQNGQNAVFSLKEFITSPWVYGIGQAFAFFALTTSFLGVTLGLVDFLADGLKVAKIGLKKVALCFAVFFPPVVISCSRPGIFLSALTYAGGIGCALLLGLMPVLMVWVGRYQKGYGVKHAQIAGGKKFLSLLIFFVVFEVIVECIAEIRG